MFAKLRCYRDQHRHCNVPSDSELGAWVSNQREFQNAGRLRTDRKARLDELKFIWDAREAAWEAMFDELKRYKEEHRHCNVRTDTRYKEHPQPKLAAWLNKQRKLQKEGRLRADRKARLDELKFIWDTLEAAWETMFNEAIQGGAPPLQRPAEREIESQIRNLGLLPARASESW
jgi:hypothetical protein